MKIFGTDYPTPDGTCIRDYIHVDDLARAHLRALEWLEGKGQGGVFNLGNGTGYSVREVVQAAQKVTKVSFPVTETARRAGDPARLVADASRARKELSWKPVYENLEDIISHAWVWHKTHPNGYGK